LIVPPSLGVRAEYNEVEALVWLSGMAVMLLTASGV
jgi:hypothetical protein